MTAARRRNDGIPEDTLCAVGRMGLEILAFREAMNAASVWNKRRALPTAGCSVSNFEERRDCLKGPEWRKAWRYASPPRSKGLRPRVGEFIKADLSLMSEAQRVARALPAETLDRVIFTNGIFAAPKRQETAEGI